MMAGRLQKGLAILLYKLRRWLWAQLFGSLYDDLRDLRRKYPDLKHNRAVLKEKVSQVIQRWIDAHRRRLSLSRWLLKRPRGGKIYYRNILIGDRELALYAHVWAPTPRGKVRARQRPHLYYDEMEALIPLQDGLVIENYEAPKLE